MDDDSFPVEDLIKLKLIVIGNQGTGKSCILNRFVNESFDDNYQATIGLDFQSKNITIQDQDVRLILYDTAGQEKFRSLIPMYIREAQIILLIYDISDRDSFDSIPKWLQEVLDVKNSDVVFALIGNKIDLENKRVVTLEEGKKLAEEKNFIFQEISAKTGKNFERLFEGQLFEAIYTQFTKEFDKREKMMNNVNEDQATYDTHDHAYNTNDNKVKLETNLTKEQKVKKKKKCC